MKLDHYISKLLFRYDCVIVPNLGGFVTNYKPANIHPIKNTFYPPSKGISFNKNLIHNDGLLANAISQENGISYEKALSIIEQGVAKIQQDLKHQNYLVTLDEPACQIHEKNTFSAILRKTTFRAVVSVIADLKKTTFRAVVSVI